MTLSLSLKLCEKASMYTLLGNVNKFCAWNIKILIDLFNKMTVPNALTTVRYGSFHF